MTPIAPTIVQTVVLKAPLDRVWRAISDSRRFGAWFGAAIDGPFVAGAAATGRIEPTTVDPEVARSQEPHRGVAWRIAVDRIEPGRLFSFRWHPFAIDPARDYSTEPMTLVRFELSQGDDGVVLTISESGFEGLPPGRREQAIEANRGGWAHQARLIARYLDLPEP